MTTGAIKSCKAPVKSSPPTNQHPVFFTGWMPFQSPNQQCQALNRKISHSMDLLTTSSPGGLPTLSLTTNSSWLPWGRVAISPLMPVPQLFQIYPSIRVHQRQCNFRKRNQVIWIIAPLRDALQWLLVLANDDDGYVIQYNTIQYKNLEMRNINS